MQDYSTFIHQHPGLSFGLFVVLSLLIIVELLRFKQRRVGLNPQQLTQLINHQSAAIIDLRPVDAFNQGHIINASRIPVNELQKTTKIEKYKNAPLVLVCQSGLESQKIATELHKKGYNTSFLSGGMRAWLEAQMPIIKG